MPQEPRDCGWSLLRVRHKTANTFLAPLPLIFFMQMNDTGLSLYRTCLTWSLAHTLTLTIKPTYSSLKLNLFIVLCCTEDGKSALGAIVFSSSLNSSYCKVGELVNKFTVLTHCH